MKKVWKDVNGYKFLQIKIDPVFQKNKAFYIARIPADFLLKVHTVEPAIYNIEKESALASTFDTTENYFKYRLDVTQKRIEEGKFERKEDPERVANIARWLNAEEYALFPNTIIVTCDLMNDLLNIGPFEKFSEVKGALNDDLESLCFLEEDEDPTKDSYIYIPYNPEKFKSILVIDGQHRLRGLMEAGENIQKDYDLLVSFIIGFDRSEVAKLFYTINYEQKAVNKSLLYHLSGEFSTRSDVDKIAFLHEVVRTINEVEESPFFRRVKMLGVIDKEIVEKERRKFMTISQAFLIDYLISTISGETKSTLYPPIFLYYFKNEKLQIEIVRFLLKYFTAIKESNKESWNDPESSIICNSVSVGAFLRAMNFIFVTMFFDDFGGDPMAIRDVTIERLQSGFRGIKNIDFSKNGPYGKSASGGSLNMLRKEIIENISFFKKQNYDEFLDRYKTEYLERFWQWMKGI